MNTLSAFQTVAENCFIKSAHYLSQNIANAELKIIENTSYVVNEEKPKVVAQILEKFYNKAL